MIALHDQANGPSEARIAVSRTNMNPSDGFPARVQASRSSTRKLLCAGCRMGIVPFGDGENATSNSSCSRTSDSPNRCQFNVTSNKSLRSVGWRGQPSRMIPVECDRNVDLKRAISAKIIE